MNKSASYSLVKSSLLFIVIALIQACSLNVPIQEPEVSGYAYTANAAKEALALNITTNFDENHQASNGRVKINLVHNRSALKTSPFLITSLKKELASRQLPIDYNGTEPYTVNIKEFEILNHRVSSFSPMVTISTIKVLLTTPQGDKTIAAMVKRAKVPVWSMNEINEPCYNEPIEILIKEVAAKINKELFGYALTDAQVDTLVAKIQAETDTNKLSYFDVYELGFSNNLRALGPLKKLLEHNKEYIRMAAISSLGILGVEDNVGDLIGIYKDASMWQDRGMALKSIGDIGNEQALEFLKQEKSKWQNKAGSEAQWNLSIINLYI